jgi:quercetin dioxygenase-like cupin family protein
MAIHFNESEVAAVAESGVARQALLDATRVPGIRFELERLMLAAGAEARLAVAPRDLAWFQMLAGAATVRHADRDVALTAAHVAFLPPGFAATLASEKGAALLLARVPDALALDPALATGAPPFRLVDWRDEPVLESKHDARKRIYLITPKLFGTAAIRGEMIIYPPGTECPLHHHEGGAHFMYFLQGRGTCYAGDQPIPVRAGDVVYYADHEPHYIRGGDEEMVFSEFFVPGAVNTIWADPSQVCTWLPTGKNVRGGAPSREIKEHRHGQLAEV